MYSILGSFFVGFVCFLEIFGGVGLCSFLLIGVFWWFVVGVFCGCWVLFLFCF